MTAQGGKATAMDILLDVLCPLHLVVEKTGHIRKAGPAIRKLSPGRPLEGMRLLEFLELRRPSRPRTMQELTAYCGENLRFTTRLAPRTELKGVMVPLPEGLVPGLQAGSVLNLSFGISVLEAVRSYALTSADFAVTDLTIEMLYLVEAKSAVMDELRHLNLRLDGARAEAEYKAFTDKLTGLGNRRAMEQALNRLIGQGRCFAVMQIDLDHFKAVNDKFGHAAGDAVLQATADRLQDCTRETDIIIRQGGDEFLLILPEMMSVANVEDLAIRLIMAIEGPVAFESEGLHVSASIGISLLEAPGEASPEVLLERADAALYAVKAAGRGGYCFFAANMQPMAP